MNLENKEAKSTKAKKANLRSKKTLGIHAQHTCTERNGEGNSSGCRKTMPGEDSSEMPRSDISEEAGEVEDMICASVIL